MRVPFLTVAFLLMLTSYVGGNSIGERVSDIIVKFANNGLGVGDMQDYVKDEVVFQEEKIDADSVEKLANEMSEKLQRRVNILKELQETIKESYTNTQTDDVYSYDTCCNIALPDNSSFLNVKVNLKEWCVLGDILRSDNPPASRLPDQVLEKIKTLYGTEEGLKYIYFGSEDGVLYNFPGIKYCASYDPRFKPWYVQTATPEPKDVVIVIDRSGSMKSSISSGGQTLMEVAVDAAITVVDTLNPDDRVGVVTFSTNAETPPGKDDDCFSSSLAKATSQNKKYLREFVSDASPDGDTFYNTAFEKAFEYFKNTPEEDGTRAKVILFLTDGIPSDDNKPDSIYDNLRSLNAQLNNEVVILTYFLSTSSSPEAEMILTNIANQTFYDPSYGTVTPGQFTHVSNPENLRTEMASFYERFESSSEESAPTFSAPFLDPFNTSNIQISMCLPVKNEGHIKGVVCIDQSVDDIMSDVTYFKKGDLAYAFVIDSQARVLSHPLLINPADLTADPVFVQLPSLEVAAGIEEVMIKMTRGEKGQTNLQSLRVIPRGSLYTAGVNTLRIASTYYWHPVAGSTFSVCVVSSNIDKYETIQWDQEYPQEFVYHLNRVYETPRDTCRLFAREALRDLGNIKFSARAFLDPYGYSYGQETAVDIQAYEDYFTGKSNSNPGFRSGVREDVAFTYRFEELMESRLDYGDYAIWRYIATETGVVRIFPGTEIPVMFDPLVRPWYIRSMSVPALYSVSTPYIDALGAGIILTISKAILSPSEDVAVGVIGVDVTLAYLDLLLTEEIPECTQYDCILMDQSGFVVLHSKWLRPEEGQTSAVAGVHISSEEPDIAHDLVQQNVLQPHSCINLEALNEQKFWKMSFRSFQQTSWYELIEVPNTNVYVIIKKGSASQSEECSCPENQDVEMCSLEGRTCFCPCYSKTDAYSYCSGVFSLSQDGDPPCSPPIPSVDFSYISKREASIVVNLDVCREYQCDNRLVRSECVGVASCSWCAYNEEGDLLEKPYCSTWDKCAFGIGPAKIIRTTPKSDSAGGLHAGIIALIVIMSISAIAVLVIIIIWKIYKKKRSFGKSLQRANTTQNPYIGIIGAQGGGNTELQKASGASDLCTKVQNASESKVDGRPKSMFDDMEVYDELRDSIVLPPPPDELLVGFKPRGSKVSLPPTPPPEELPDNYNDDFMEGATVSPNTKATTKHENTDDHETVRRESDVYLKPKDLTNAKETNYTGLKSLGKSDNAVSNDQRRGSENDYLKFQSITKPDDNMNQRKLSDVYLTPKGTRKQSQHLDETMDPRESYKRLVDAYPVEAQEKS